MKKANIINVTSNGNVVFEESGNFKESSFQGFKVSTDILSRHLFSKYINNIECTFSKNSKIRFYDKQIINQMLKLGVFTIKPEQLTDSKAYTLDEKSMFKESATGATP